MAPGLIAGSKGSLHVGNHPLLRVKTSRIFRLLECGWCFLLPEGGQGGRKHWFARTLGAVLGYVLGTVRGSLEVFTLIQWFAFELEALASMKRGSAMYR